MKLIILQVKEGMTRKLLSDAHRKYTWVGTMMKNLFQCKLKCMIYYYNTISLKYIYIYISRTLFYLFLIHITTNESTETHVFIGNINKMNTGGIYWKQGSIPHAKYLFIKLYLKGTQFPTPCFTRLWKMGLGFNMLLLEMNDNGNI